MAPAGLSTRWRHLRDGSRPLPQALRYLVIGTATTLLQLGMVWLLTRPVGAVTAFLISWAASTALATLGHRLITFRRDRPDRRDQLVGYATSAASLGANTAALRLVGSTDGLTGALIVLAVNFAIGCLRFVALRWWFVGGVRDGEKNRHQGDALGPAHGRIAPHPRHGGHTPDPVDAGLAEPAGVDVTASADLPTGGDDRRVRDRP